MFSKDVLILRQLDCEMQKISTVNRLYFNKENLTD